MGLKLGSAPKGSGGVCAPAGSHAARCYSVVDLGTHTEAGKFGTKTNRKVRVSWELPDELHTFSDERGPEPFAVHREYNFVLGERANLQKDLESWRGHKFQENDLLDFDISSLVGKPCLVSVVHTTANNGNTYAKVTSINPLPKALRGVMSDAINKPVYYDIEMGQGETFQNLPDFIRERIKKCNEWQGSQVDDSDGTEANTTPADDNFLGGKEDDDGVPF